MSLIEIIDVSVVYKQGTPFEVTALEHISLTIGKGQFVGLIGATGSGKSTLIQLFNGLLKPTSGRVLVNGIDLAGLRGTQFKDLRRRIGIVFQYPENQLFEETVFRDIAFGPNNMGLSERDIVDRVVQAMGFVGLDYSSFKDRSPFTLSGGEMRRVAIAGVLAMGPEMLVLDEPTAGMDPLGRREILKRVEEINKTTGTTVVLVSHSMEDIARLAENIFVLQEGRKVLEGSPGSIFTGDVDLSAHGLDIPQVTRLMQELGEARPDIRRDIFTVEGAKKELLRQLWRTGNA